MIIYPYPYIFFYNVGQPFHDRVLSNIQNTSKYYLVNVTQLFAKELPELPVFKGREINSSLTSCVGRFWPFGYVSMIRFRTVLMWNIPLLKHFDYLLSIDADAAVVHTNVDFFKQAKDANSVIGYHACVDDGGCLIGFWQATEKYIADNNIKPKHWENLPRNHAFYGNFVIFEREFWTTNTGVHDYFNWIDTTGGIYFYRWAEQAFNPVAAAMFIPYDRVHKIGGDYEIIHYGGPVRSVACHGVPEPKCCGPTYDRKDDPNPRPIPGAKNKKRWNQRWGE